MGKYPDSILLSKYSDWHWNKCSRRTYAIDQDIGIVYQPFAYRLWIELREIDNEIKPVAVLDIKSFSELSKSITKCSRVWYDWLVARQMPVYLVYTDIQLKEFQVKGYPDGELKSMTESEYIQFLDNLTIRKI
jgi:hypothetical protein